MTKVIPFAELHEADLIVDAIYEGSSDGLLRGEPLKNLELGFGNMGGFRFSGTTQDKKLVALFSTGEDKDWPDRLDPISGRFVYYGDNKTPGHELHNTSKGGNKILRRIFEILHAALPEREKIPPILLFGRFPTDIGSRSVQFRGLAVPGFPGMPATEDLVAVWKTTNNQRFQNYRSVFTVLDVPIVQRDWLTDIKDGNRHTDNAPKTWAKWVSTGEYDPLCAEATTTIRTEQEQTPQTPLERRILKALWNHFHAEEKEQKRKSALVFERFGAFVFKLHGEKVVIDEITRGSVDGGRDAIGRYQLGFDDDPVYAEFSLEAKCYRPPLDGQSPNTVGVKEVSRLISRIRHRQFGVLVTTSVIARQAYQEVREDSHPIIFICGRDIAEILIKAGYNSAEQVSRLLNDEFPV